MRIIPVIDLKQGLVVHAVAGDREQYRPIQSVLTERVDPAGVAQAFRRYCNSREIYVADLDAITGGEIDCDSLQQIAAEGPEIILDAGVCNIQRAEQLLALSEGLPPLASIVLGLESLPNHAMLRECLKVLGLERSIFSLDLRDGQPIIQAKEWRGFTALQIASDAIDLGIRRIIVLDLGHVGTGRGPSALPLCRELRTRYPALEIIAGGGVRCQEDLDRMADSGCSAALIASALHNGRLATPDNAKSPEYKDRQR